MSRAPAFEDATETNSKLARIFGEYFEFDVKPGIKCRAYRWRGDIYLDELFEDAAPPPDTRVRR